MRDMAVGEGCALGRRRRRRPAVFQVDPRSGAIRGRRCSRSRRGSIAAGEGGVWVTGSIDDVLARLDPGTGAAVQIIHVGRGAGGVAVGAGASGWRAPSTTRSRGSTRATGKIVERIPVDGAPREIAFGRAASG